MRQRLLALAALVASAGAGTLVFVNWDTGDRVRPRHGAFEILEDADCTPSACGVAACTQANNILTDAGSSCTTRLITCDNVRVGPAARQWAADNGLTLSASKYQTLRFIGLRCPGTDGGFAFGIPMNDAGLPQFMSVSQQTPKCVRAPLAGGTGCQRSQRDGGFRYFGAGNVFPAAESNGHASCEPVGCRVLFGDNPDTDL